MNQTSISSLIDALNQSHDGLKNNKKTARREMLTICQSIINELEEPVDTLFRIVASVPTQAMATRTALDLDIFKTIESKGKTGVKSTELAVVKGADVKLVARLMRHLAAMGVVSEVGPDTFTNSKFSRSFAVDKMMKPAYSFMFDYNTKATIDTPKYFRETNFRNPEDQRNCIYQYSTGVPVGTTMFEKFAQTPEQGQAFGALMTAYAGVKPVWTDEGFYPVRERVVDVTSPEETLLVDVAGGMGHDSAKFRRNYPDIVGRIVVQELPYIVERFDQPGVEAMVHDFNDPQPIKGAQFYYMRQIMHDYNDEKCRSILQQIVPAMKPGYSKVLICDFVVPERGASAELTMVDMELMKSLAAGERTERQFRELLEGVGLKLSGIWKHPEGEDSVIEAVLV